MINDHIRQSNLYKIMTENSHNDEEICREISSYITTKIDIDIIDKLLTICDKKYRTYEQKELLNLRKNIRKCDVESMIDILDHIKFINNNNALLIIINVAFETIRYRDCIHEILNNNYLDIYVVYYLSKPYECPKIIIHDDRDEFTCSFDELIKFCLESTYIKELKCIEDVKWIIPLITLHNDLEVLEIESPNTQLGCYARLNNLHTLKINYCREFDYTIDKLYLQLEHNNNIEELVSVINNLENLSKLYLPFGMLTKDAPYSITHELDELHLYKNKVRDSDEGSIYIDNYVCTNTIDLHADDIDSLTIYIYLSDIEQLTVLNSGDNDVFIVTNDSSKWKIVYNDDEHDSPNAIWFSNRTKEVVFKQLQDI